VRRDDRGLLTDIAEALPDCKSILFDYNQFDDSAETLTVAPLTDQAKHLSRVLDQARADHPGAIIDLVCHSQGCVAAALAKPTGIRRIIFLTPPASLSAEHMQRSFSGRPGSVFDSGGTSRLARRDGSTTVVESDYWNDIKGLKPIELYSELASHTELTMIIANQDEVLGDTNFSGLNRHAEILNINSDHNLTHEARPELIELIAKILL